MAIFDAASLGIENTIYSRQYCILLCLKLQCDNKLGMVLCCFSSTVHQCKKRGPKVFSEYIQHLCDKLELGLFAQHRMADLNRPNPCRHIPKCCSKQS